MSPVSDLPSGDIAKEKARVPSVFDLTNYLDAFARMFNEFRLEDYEPTETMNSRLLGSAGKVEGTSHRI